MAVAATRTISSSSQTDRRLKPAVSYFVLPRRPKFDVLTETILGTIKGVDERMAARALKHGIQPYKSVPKPRTIHELRQHSFYSRWDDHGALITEAKQLITDFLVLYAAREDWMNGAVQQHRRNGDPLPKTNGKENNGPSDNGGQPGNGNGFHAGNNGPHGTGARSYWKSTGAQVEHRTPPPSFLELAERAGRIRSLLDVMGEKGLGKERATLLNDYEWLSDALIVTAMEERARWWP